MIETWRHVGQLYELRDLRPNDALQTLNVGTEMPLAMCARQQPDRRDTVVRREALCAEHALRFTARGCFPLMVAHCHLAVV